MMSSTAKDLLLHATARATHLARTCALVCFATVCSAAMAEDNAIESISANQQGANVIVRVQLKKPVEKSPIGFSITSPARIALDFAGTSNATGKTTQDIGLGDVRNVNVVQAGERSRLVFNLSRPLNYATVVEGNSVIVTIDASGGVATAVSSVGLPVATPANAATASALQSAGGRQALRDIDFRRGTGGEGRIVVDLPNNQVGVDVRQQGQTVVVDFMKASLPEVLRRRLDVTDFGTPVSIRIAPCGPRISNTVIASVPTYQVLPYILNGLTGWFHSLQLPQFSADSPACATPDSANTSASASFFSIAILSSPDSKKGADGALR